MTEVGGGKCFRLLHQHINDTADDEFHSTHITGDTLGRGRSLLHLAWDMYPFEPSLYRGDSGKSLSQNGRAMNEHFSRLLEGRQECYTDDRSLSAFSDRPVSEDNIRGSLTPPKNGNDRFCFPALDTTKASVRVIKVLPAANPDETIRCELEVVPLSNSHVALSYVWGTDPPSHLIEVNGKAFFVRSNLKAFLKYARQYFPETTLWIDAISINQNDINERNNQVRQMTQIYEKAKLVLVWLGRNMNLTMNLLSKLRTYDYGWSLESYLERFLSHEWREAVGELFLAEYWSRLWIVPEILSARKLRVASADGSISWECFIHFVRAFCRSGAPICDHDGVEWWAQGLRLADFRDIRNGSLNVGKDFGHLLQAYGESKCSDLRDRVFVLINLSKYHDCIQIDYHMTRLALFRHVVEELYHPDGENEGYKPGASPKIAHLFMRALEISPADYLGTSLNEILTSHCDRHRRRKASLWITLLMWPPSPSLSLPEVAYTIPTDPRDMESISRYSHLTHCGARWLPAASHVKTQLFSGHTFRDVSSRRRLEFETNFVLKDISAYWVDRKGISSWNMWVMIAKISLYRLFGLRTIYSRCSRPCHEECQNDVTSTAIEDHWIEQLYHDLVLEDSRHVLSGHMDSDDPDSESKVSCGQYSEAPRHVFFRLCRSLKGFQNIRSRVQYMVSQNLRTVSSVVYSNQYGSSQCEQVILTPQLQDISRVL